MSFPKYPEYKDSGVEWLGEVPAHWVVGTIARIIKAPITDGPHTTPEFTQSGIPFLSVDGVQEGELVFEGCRFISARDYARFSRKAAPRRDDILMGKAASIGKVARVKTDKTFGIWSPLALIRVDKDKYSSGFLEYVLKSPGAQHQLNQLANSNTQLNLGMKDIPKIRVLVPPIEEQLGVAAFLDHETGKIDALIEEQRRLIELLKEKRQAAISHAVTKGLDPSVPMKDSGVEWLGEVPAHWEVLKLGFVTVEKCDGPFGSALKSEHYTSDGVRVVRLQNIKKGRFNDDDSAFISETYYTDIGRRSGVASGDLLIAGLGDERNAVGRACVAPEGIEPAMVKADCFRFRLDASRAKPGFLAEQLSASAEVDAGQLSTGSTRSRIPLSVMVTRRVALPSIREQDQIAEYVKGLKRSVDQLMVEAANTIDLLQERRSALISAAVTGKIDVRGWSAGAESGESELAMVAEESAGYSAQGGAR